MTNDKNNADESGNEWKPFHDPEGVMMSELPSLYNNLDSFIEKFKTWEDEEANNPEMFYPVSHGDMYVILYLAKSLHDLIGGIDELILFDDDLPADDESGEDDISPIGNI